MRTWHSVSCAAGYLVWTKKPPESDGAYILYILYRIGYRIRDRIRYRIRYIYIIIYDIVYDVVYDVVCDTP